MKKDDGHKDKLLAVHRLWKCEEAKDAEGWLEAFNVLFDLLEKEPHEEAEHGESKYE